MFSATLSSTLSRGAHGCARPSSSSPTGSISQPQQNQRKSQNDEQIDSAARAAGCSMAPAARWPHLRWADEITEVNPLSGDLKADRLGKSWYRGARSLVRWRTRRRTGRARQRQQTCASSRARLPPLRRDGEERAAGSGPHPGHAGMERRPRRQDHLRDRRLSGNVGDGRRELEGRCGEQVVVQDLARIFHQATPVFSQMYTR